MNRPPPSLRNRTGSAPRYCWGRPKRREHRAGLTRGAAVAALAWGAAVAAPGEAPVDLGRPGEVVADEQVQVAVAVGVEEGGAGRPVLVGPRHSGRRRHVLEAAAPIVEQVVRSDGGDVEVGPAVAVVVAHRHALPVDREVEAGGRGHVMEPAGAVVGEQRQARSRSRSRPLRPLVPRPVGGAHEQQVGVAVPVVVEDRHPAAHGLGQELLAVGAVVVDEGDARGRGDVGEGQGGWRRDARPGATRRGRGADGTGAHPRVKGEPGDRRSPNQSAGRHGAPPPAGASPSVRGRTRRRAGRVR